MSHREPLAVKVALHAHLVSQLAERVASGPGRGLNDLVAGLDGLEDALQQEAAALEDAARLVEDTLAGARALVEALGCPRCHGPHEPGEQRARRTCGCSCHVGYERVLSDLRIKLGMSMEQDEGRR